MTEETKLIFALQQELINCVFLFDRVCNYLDEYSGLNSAEIFKGGQEKRKKLIEIVRSYIFELRRDEFPAAPKGEDKCDHLVK